MTWTSPALRHRCARMELSFIPSDEREDPEMKIRHIGLDIAKNTYFVCGVDERGQVLVQKKLKRSEVLLNTLTVNLTKV